MVFELLLAAAAGYLLGSLPMGYFFVKIFKHRDITRIGSGRTGGTNAMRAGGLWVGLLTALADLCKGYLAVWLAQQTAPEAIWIHTAAGAAAVTGHNWSIWVYHLTGRFAGGAGTGPNVGAAIAFFPPAALIAVPIVIVFVFLVGYASLASLTAALALMATFAVRAVFLNAPWEHFVYAALTTLLVAAALRPNIERLRQGTERRVGLFARPKGDHLSS
ncbi:MAG: hypothetical protein GX495_02150 [Chloroflexi bacterium]|jgi:glycerol-3-phosphate acyltransferase PlsY|nr:hypothetical protein [Chloroflexota bacterium]